MFADTYIYNKQMIYLIYIHIYPRVCICMYNVLRIVIWLRIVFVLHVVVYGIISLGSGLHMRTQQEPG